MAFTHQQQRSLIQHPHARRHAGGGGMRSRSSTSSSSSKPLTFCIGIGMFLLMIAYVLIVVVVTFLHWPSATTSGGSYNDAIHTSIESISSLQQRWNEMKEMRGGSAKDNANNNKNKKDNPFRKHNLDNPITHGVQPEVIVPPSPHRADISNAEESIVAAKDDGVPIDQHPAPNYVLTAYLEPLNFDDWNTNTNKNQTTTTTNLLPLPRRKVSAADLTRVEYPRLNSCRKLPQQFPVDDTPANVDSFLPWIHDVFPTADGKYIQIVAQNRRRCKNGSKEKDILAHQQPQAALFQHVSVQRVKSDDAGSSSSNIRYKLCPHEQADPDAIATRFICRFKPDHTETLSVYNFDYDWTAYRKRYKASFVEDDAGIKAIHTSQLVFQCPVPEHLVETVRTGRSVVNNNNKEDYYASLFLDIVPIRTPPRWGVPNQYFPPQYKDRETTDPSEKFDPIAAWGDNHVLPAIEDSGRWENIPICKPSLMTYEDQTEDDVLLVPAVQEKPVKKHRLVSCIWASAGYTTRGSRFAINDGQRRLLEWITYNKIIGFDHFYLYDNSGAFGGDTSLKGVADLFPDEVTYIPWPSQVCNNNPNNVDSVGERSSQYAAESSCRLRFGPHVDWIGQFDIDEYLVPMGRYKMITQLLDKLEEEDTKIISFASWRAWPRRAFIEEPVKINDGNICWHNEPCFELKIPYKHTMLQAYNCDRQKPGQKASRMPAEKQLYQPDYVLQHFVHYSVATVQSEKNETEYTKDGFQWKRRGFPDPRQRFGNELTEGLMVHTKAVARQDTAGWERMCHINNTYLPRRRQGLCRLGLPYPDDWTPAAVNATPEGWAYNCYVNPQVEDYLVPLLKEKLAIHSGFFEAQ